MISTPIVAELDATPASLYLCTALVVRQLGETALFIQSSGPDFKSAVVRQDFKLPLILFTGECMSFKYKCNCKMIRILSSSDRSEICQWCKQAITLIGPTDPVIAPFVQIPRHHQASPKKST